MWLRKIIMKHFYTPYTNIINRKYCVFSTIAKVFILWQYRNIVMVFLIDRWGYLCLLAGCTVHQHASPWLCSCKPTSKASLSLLELVDKQAKYCKTSLIRYNEINKINYHTISLLRCLKRMALPYSNVRWPEPVPPLPWK